MSTQGRIQKGAKQTYRKRVSLSETEEGLKLLQDLARRRGVTVSDLLRMLVREEAARAGVPVGASGVAEGGPPPIWERMASSMAALPEEALESLPGDLAEQHDHYLSGTPKR